MFTRSRHVYNLLEKPARRTILPAAAPRASAEFILWLSAAVYAVGFFTAFGLGPLLLWWDSRH